MLNQQTLEKLRTLRLFTMAKSLEERLSQPGHRDLEASELIGLIVDDEYLARENAKLASLLRLAKFKERAACMEDIDYKTNRGLKKQMLLELGQLHWIQKAQNIAFTGPSGSGKSYLAQALGNQACRQGKRVIYIRLPKLLTALHQSRVDGSYATLLKRFERAHVLVLDDLGVCELNDNDRRDLLEIIEDRYGQGSTVITSQLPTKDWHSHFGSGRAADSLCDRLLHSCHRVELLAQCESQRKLRSTLD
jgi:DNA replication protein DnaC